MAPAETAVQEPATGAPPAQPAQPGQPVMYPAGPPSLDRDQIIHLLQNSGIFTKPDGTLNLQNDAAQVLSTLQQQQQQQSQKPQSQSAAAPPFPPGAAPPPGSVPLPHHIPFPPGLAPEPGPNSHPRGPPPSLGQLSAAVAMQSVPQGPPPIAGDSLDDDDLSDGKGGKDMDSPNTTPAPSGGRRGGRSGAAMGSDEWTRQRKDNHKEVERRRRSNINEGINELGRIVPNGSGEKSKGAILSRAVQYIHHLKENEARNIEKWTLEKLLMDQAMGDLQAQLEEVRNMWTEERNQRQRLEAELEVVRTGGAGSGESNKNGKRPHEEEKQDEDKRQRTE